MRWCWHLTTSSLLCSWELRPVSATSRSSYLSTRTTSTLRATLCRWRALSNMGGRTVVTCESALVSLMMPVRYGREQNGHIQPNFWQRVSIACYAERCPSHDRFSVRPSDRLSVTVRYHAKTTPATIMRSSLEDSPMLLVSWRLTSPRNSKGNIGREGAEWERGRENLAKIGNF